MVHLPWTSHSSFGELVSCFTGGEPRLSDQPAWYLVTVPQPPLRTLASTSLALFLYVCVCGLELSV